MVFWGHAIRIILGAFQKYEPHSYPGPIKQEFLKLWLRYQSTVNILRGILMC